MLGDAAGGGEFSFKNGSTRLGSDQTGYPLIFPCTHTHIMDFRRYLHVQAKTKVKFYMCVYIFLRIIERVVPKHLKQLVLPFLLESTA